MKNSEHVMGKVISEIERWFDILNSNYFENKLDTPIITIQKTRQNNLGHFSVHKIWENFKNKKDDNSKNEINISANNLNRPVVEIVGTLLHEMVHYANTISDIQDCSGQIHNKKFKNTAEAVGFFVERDSRVGWGYTKVEKDSKLDKFIKEKVSPKEELFSFFRSVSEKEVTPKERNKRMFKYVCPDCGLEIKAKEGVSVRCNECDVVLEKED